MPDLPSGTVTFLFTDIEGSPARWERDRQAMATAVARHLTLLRAVTEAHNGVLFKVVGDAVQAAFLTAPAPLPPQSMPNTPCSLRIGVNRVHYACAWRRMPARRSRMPAATTWQHSSTASHGCSQRGTAARPCCPRWSSS
jgi:class 3 adenylate cyclase